MNKSTTLTALPRHLAIGTISLPAAAGCRGMGQGTDKIPVVIMKLQLPEEIHCGAREVWKKRYNLYRLEPWEGIPSLQDQLTDPEYFSKK